MIMVIVRVYDTMNVRDDWDIANALSILQFVLVDRFRGSTHIKPLH
jgi:hypothetical protein